MWRIQLLSHSAVMVVVQFTLYCMWSVGCINEASHDFSEENIAGELFFFFYCIFLRSEH